MSIQRFVYHSYRVLLAVVLLVSLVGCTQLPSVNQAMTAARRALGQDPTFFEHLDHPAPPTLTAFAVMAQLDQTQRIEFTDPQSGQRRTISDQAAIQRMLALLLQPPSAASTAVATPVQQPALHIDFIVRPPERTFTLLYTPQTGRVAFFNVPTREWREHLVGYYSTAPAFGQQLHNALSQP